MGLLCKHMSWLIIYSMINHMAMTTWVVHSYQFCHFDLHLLTDLLQRDVDIRAISLDEEKQNIWKTRFTLAD